MSDQNPNDFNPNAPYRPPFGKPQQQPQQNTPFSAPQAPQSYPQAPQQAQQPQYNPAYGQQQQQPQQGYQAQPNPYVQQQQQNPYGQPQFGGPQGPYNNGPQGPYNGGPYNGGPQQPKKSPLVWIISGVAAFVVLLVIIVSVVVVGAGKDDDKTPTSQGTSSTEPSSPSSEGGDSSKDVTRDANGETSDIQEPTSSEMEELRTSENDKYFDAAYDKLGFVKTSREEARKIGLSSCVILTQKPTPLAFGTYILKSGDPYENGEAVAIGASAYCPSASSQLKDILTRLQDVSGSDSDSGAYSG